MEGFVYPRVLHVTGLLRDARRSLHRHPQAAHPGHKFFRGLKGEERLRSTATVQGNTLPLGGSEAQEVWTLGHLGQEGVIAAQQEQLRGLAGLPRELCQKWPADLRTDLIVPGIVVCATMRRCIV